MGSESTEDERVRKSLPVTMLVVIDTQVHFGIRPKRGAVYQRQKVVRYGLILRLDGVWRMLNGTKPGGYRNIPMYLPR